MHLFYALSTEHTPSITIIDVHNALIGGVNVPSKAFKKASALGLRKKGYT